MKKLIFIFLMTTIMVGCNKTDNQANNPFFVEFDTPYGVPPFDKIEKKHYLPAFEKGMEEQQVEIDSIVNNRNEPTFENTSEQLERSGSMLLRVSNVFFNLQSTLADEEMDKIAQEITPKLTAHNDNIYLNGKLFQRIKKLYDNRKNLNLSAEQNRLLEKQYKQFIRSGANLTEDQKTELRKINKELSSAELLFGQNVLAETNSYKKFVTNEEDLAGLPEDVKQAAAEAAVEAGKKGVWLFTTQKTSFIPVLQYGENRELRKELLMAYTTRCNHDNKSDNKEVIQKIMKLRVKKAKLLGFDSPADFILDNTMAKTPKAVYSLINDVWAAALNRAKNERKELQALMTADGVKGKLQAWDWWYYAEKLRMKKYSLNEEELRPYFKLENVRKGVFDLTSQLYGLKYQKMENMPIYHPDVEVFKVTDADDSLIGILYTDYFPRASKNVGAWMSNFTEQYIQNDSNYRPVIVNVGNFTKPTAQKPSLLTMDDVETLFHEYGHAIHGLLAQSTYRSLSGTNVARDFVEMPSQVMEYWCWEPEVMKGYARHYKTGKVMPQELMDKIAKASAFNQGFVMTELLSAALLDMDFHTMTDTTGFDVMKFEEETLNKIGLIPEIIVRYRSPFFKHIFEGGYSAGYYGYTWSEVIAADAYAKFKESGNIFNKKIAIDFRKKILERGDSDEPMTLYKDFRGAEPNPKALLKKRGLK